MGNKTRQSCYGLAILAMLCGACASWAQEEGALNQQFVVAVYDDAGVAPDVVLRAEAAADRVFRGAGIHVQWTNPLWEERAAVVPVAEQETRGRLMVRIVPHSRSLKGEIFGLAFLDEDGRGRQADIFYNGIVRLSASGSHDSAVLLGSVMVHELGHLLLGSHSHSSSGIMRGRWDESVLQLAAAGLEGFSAEQAARMQGRIASFVETHATVVSARAQERERVEESWIASVR